MIKSYVISILAGLLLMTGCTTKTQKPNVVFIYADDLGKGLLSHEGQQFIKTPNIDKLGKQGIRFTNARGAMFCAPARASLLTGYHDCHTNKYEINRGGQLIPQPITGEKSDSLLNNINARFDQKLEQDFFLPQVFKKEGYTTGQVGKLEWGFTTTPQQMDNHGWDYYYGYLDHVRAHGFYPPFLFENGNVVSIEGNTYVNCAKTREGETHQKYQERWNMEGKKHYSEELFIDKALQFIRDNKSNPFFLYYPTQLPHGPVAIPKVHPDFKNDTILTPIEKEYASMVKMFDDHVGVIIEELKKQGLYENTMIIFSSDNGHELYYDQPGRTTKQQVNILTGERLDNITTKYYSATAVDIFDGNKGRAGRKFSNWEGGLNVPLIVSYPEMIQGGQQSDALVANFDWITTFADMFAQNIPKVKDGVSFLPILKGEQMESEHPYIINASMHGPCLVTKDGWKLRYFKKAGVFQLYFLPDDYREEHDLSTQYSKKVEELKTIMIQECEGNLDNGYFTYAKNVLGV